MVGKLLRVGALGLLLLLLGVLPHVTGSAYYVHLANMAGISIILTLSLNLVFGYTGQISIGHAAFYAVGAYTTAILMARMHWPFWAVVPASMLTAGLAGIVIGLPALRLKGFYLAMATLGFAVVVFVVLQQWRDFTGGAMGIIGIPRPRMFGYEFADEFGYYYLVLAATLFTFFIVRNIIASPTGRAMIAIRESEAAAESLGINVTEHKLMAFAISAGLAGLAGSLFAPLSRFVSPDGFNVMPSFIILAMLVMGGLGSHLGAILGGLLMVLLPELIGVVGQYRVFVYSACLMLIVVFMPEGLAGLIRYLFRFVRRLFGLEPVARPSPHASSLGGRVQPGDSPLEGAIEGDTV